METRQKIEYKVYALNLSDMRGGVDKSRPIVVFDDLNNLKNWYENQLAEKKYLDEDRWYKVFKKGSPLEWFNPLSPINQQDDDKFKVVSWHDAAFGGVTEHWVDDLSFTVPFNPPI